MPHAKRTATGVLGGLAGLVGLSAIAGVLVAATVTPAIAVSGYAATSALDTFDNMPSILEIDPLMLPTELYRTDTDGNYYMFAEFYDQNRIPKTFDQVSTVMYDAIISSEDKNFYTHGGVDLVGTISALVGNASSGSNRGGSSLTQQYVKNVLQQNCEREAAGDEDAVAACYTATTVNTGAEGYQRKLQEMRYAIQLEKTYTKDEILIGYLNIANFGGSVYGIGAAAQYYFGTDAANLTIAQAATLAGMVQEPNTYRIDMPEGSTTDSDGNAVNSAADGYSLTLERRDYVLGRMLDDGKITQAEYDEAVASAITPNITPRTQGCQIATGAEFFCEYVRSIVLTDEAFGETSDERALNLRRGGMKIYTTLDPDLQATALSAISIVPASVDYMDLGSSGVQVEVGTGRILSMVQNRPYSVDADGVTTTNVNYNVRQANGGGGHSAGSTYKVFSLVNWLEQGHSVNEIVDGKIGTKTVQTCDGATQTVTLANDGTGIGNFESSSGYSGTVYNFTRDSLNSGFIAMAQTITVCSTNEVAMKLGVMRGDGTALDQDNVAYDVLGSQAVAPIDMAEAYAAIAANGILCEPKSIDKALDADGNDITPETTCERQLTESVAATAAYTLQGVMTSSGTGSGAIIGDGVPVFGKTGIHEYEQTWMDGSSTKVTTVVWVGNVSGHVKLNYYYESGYVLSRIRNGIWPVMQGAANTKYGGDEFPDPDSTLTKSTLTDLPSVVGQTVEEATSTLEAAGFTVTVGDEVDSTEAEGTVVSQSPSAGQVASGTTVTITASNGNGITVPAVSGTLSAAIATLESAGFTDIDTQCTESDSASENGTVTGTDPATGTVTTDSTQITVKYQARSCDEDE
ncbi:MAG: penicillin-binding protein [Microbacterium sp.]